jgi:hypothetical protein
LIEDREQVLLAGLAEGETVEGSLTLEAGARPT